jgi:hypothetical protein
MDANITGRSTRVRVGLSTQVALTDRIFDDASKKVEGAATPPPPAPQNRARFSPRS